MGPRLRLGIALAALMVTGGCSGGAADHRIDSQPKHRSAATSVDATAVAGRDASLSCSDSLGVPQGETIDEIPFHGLATTNIEPPIASDVLGFEMPSSKHAYFRKNPLLMRKGAADFTLEASGASQVLVWVPAGVWTTQGTQRPEVTKWAASSLTLHSCPDRPAMFLDGILAEDLETCLHLSVRQAGQPELTVHQRLDGSPCNA